MQPVIYWFRTDLRVEDNPGLRLAARLSDRLLPVYCHDRAWLADTPWGFARRARHRRRFDAAALAAAQSGDANRYAQEIEPPDRSLAEGAGELPGSLDMGTGMDAGMV